MSSPSSTSSRALARGLRPEDEVAAVASEHPNWAPPSASVAEAAALMVSLGIRHLVVLDISERPSGVVSMAELFDVLVRSQEPMALYAKFADIMLRSGSETAQPFSHELRRARPDPSFGGQGGAGGARSRRAARRRRGRPFRRPCARCGRRRSPRPRRG